VFAHFADSFLDDALHGTAPSGVKNSYSAAFAIDENDGKAIGRLHGNDDSRGVGDETVTGEGLTLRFAFIDAMDQVGMNLAQRNQWPTFASAQNAQFFEKKFSVALDGYARVMLREAKIQGFTPVGARDTAEAR
jgi:hypothetical protein